VLLSQPGESPSNSELLTRLRAELSAAGFEVVIVPTASEEAPKPLVESAGRELNPAAVVLVRERAAPELGGSSVAELWVSDRIGHRTLMQSMMLDPREHSRDMSLLAVQTVELVKARLATLALPDNSQSAPRANEPQPARPAPKEPPPDEEPPPVPATPASSSSVLATLSAGVGLLQDLGGMGGAWAPVGQIGVYLPELGDAMPGLEFSVRAAATARRLELQLGPGRAHASQAFGVVDVRMHLAPRSALHPVVSLGFGLFTVGVEGEAPTQYPTYEGRSWSGLSTAGVGLWARSTRGLAWLLDAQLLSAWRPTRVLIDGDRTGQLGAPTLFLSAGVVGVL
jgi:hypothetical protein